MQQHAIILATYWCFWLFKIIGPLTPSIKNWGLLVDSSATKSEFRKDLKAEGAQKRPIMATVHIYDTTSCALKWNALNISLPHLDFFKPASDNLLS